ncbi:unnamed protein product [marine sediment metagenome]|uniref:Uncharacterized protein n=1 Tax=marine sediment metagenome TaxID=412755 RepID=X0T385_9ZZZZ
MEQQAMEQLYIDEPCVVSLCARELGWFLQYYQAHMRYLKHKVYPDHKFVIMTDSVLHPFINDFVSYTLPLPDDFYNLGLDRDCYESVLLNSPAGSLTPPNVYSSLVNYIRRFYNKDKAVEVWTPRGCNFIINKMQQIFCKYSAGEKIKAEKPIIVVMPRARVRAANRNIPESVWKELVHMLKQTFLVVLSGTPNGACLQNYESESVVNLISYEKEDKVDKTIQYLNSAVCSVSSQSGGTHISLLSNCSSYIIGHEKDRHTIELNRFNVPTSFRYVTDYRCIDATTIVNDLRKFIYMLVKKGMVEDDSPSFDKLVSDDIIKLKELIESQ